MVLAKLLMNNRKEEKKIIDFFILIFSQGWGVKREITCETLFVCLDLLFVQFGVILLLEHKHCMTVPQREHVQGMQLCFGRFKTDYP